MELSHAEIPSTRLAGAYSIKVYDSGAFKGERPKASVSFLTFLLTTEFSS